MSDLSPNAHHKISQLRQAYLSSLPAKLNDLNRKWKTLNKESSNTSHLESLRTSCHKLAGSAASYKLPEIADSAREIDVLISKLLETTQQDIQVKNELRLNFEKLVKLMNNAMDS